MAHRSRPITALTIGLLAAAHTGGAVAGSGLAHWHAYARAAITPDYEWAERDTAARAPTVFDQRPLLSVAVDSATILRLDDESVLSIGIEQALVRDGGLASGKAMALTLNGAGLERTAVAPSLSRSVGNDGWLSAAVILASQQFATWGLGAGTRSVALPGAAPSALSETSYGTGVRVSLSQPLSSSLELTSAFQSRIDMDAFNNYRGIYSEPGDFDLPAVASVGLKWRPSARGVLGVGVSRIGYGDVAPFTSRALPPSLLALIGDGTSPVFAWRDLTVVNVDWAWRPVASTALTLRYSTQQQPEPTSNLLASALAERYTDRNFALSVLHGFGSGAAFELHASYAPVLYFLGNTSYAQRTSSGDQLEVEAVWSVPF